MRLFDRLRGSRPVDPSPDDPSTTPPPAVLEVLDPELLDPELRAHVDRLTTAAGHDPDALAPEAFDAALTARLVGQDELPADRRFHYLHAFAPHIAEVVTLDLPGLVVTLGEDRLSSHGHTLPTLVSRARRNLRALMDTEDVRPTRLGRGRRACPALVGDSAYTGSFARFLNEAVARWLPEADTQNGIVFAVPNRHTILVHPCASADDARAALDVVPDHAQRLHRDGPGPVSPHTYHWYHREISVVTVADAGGALHVEPNAVLERVVGRTRAAG